jgi:endonuclease-8
VPEGDTIHRTAETLHRFLAGRIVTRFDSVLPALTRIDEDHPIAGRVIESVTARGKHLLITFSGDLVLHTHMRMNGSWHLYRHGDRWKRPAHDMRVLVATEDAVAVGFNVPVAELLSGRDLTHHRQLQALGPDLLSASFDRQEALGRLRARGAIEIGEALLDQRVLSGIGNVFKSEILFMAGVDPFTPVRDLGEVAINRIVDIALTQLRANVAPRERTMAPARGRRTTGSLHPSKGLWVYGRGGQPCRRCGATILAKKTGLDARLTCWCPRCQDRSAWRDSDQRVVGGAVAKLSSGT